jgi:hypothetical protein
MSGSPRSILPVSPTPKRQSSRFRFALLGRRTLGVTGVGLLSLVTLTAFTSDAAFGATAVNLGAATPYGVLAGTTVTNTGPTVVTGEVGLSPGTSITGFTPGIATGTIIAADAASGNAQNSNTAAFLVASGEASTSTVSAPLGGGTTLTPGVYTGGALQLNGPSPSTVAATLTPFLSFKRPPP